MMRYDTFPCSGLSQLACGIPCSESYIIILIRAQLKNRAMRSQSGAYLCRADGHPLAYDISNGASFLAHYDFKLLGLLLFRLDLSVDFLLCSDEVVRWFFCLVEGVPISVFVFI